MNTSETLNTVTIKGHNLDVFLNYLKRKDLSYSLGAEGKMNLCLFEERYIPTLVLRIEGVSNCEVGELLELRLQKTEYWENIEFSWEKNYPPLTRSACGTVMTEGEYADMVANGIAELMEEGLEEAMADGFRRLEEGEDES